MAKTFKVTLKRSLIGCTETQKETMRCLRLSKIRQSSNITDTPANRGQIMKVQHLVDVEVVR
ncbi:MAG: 50S ribosomal protein L30 [Bdellovibrionota bacterium]